MYYCDIPTIDGSTGKLVGDQYTDINIVLGSSSYPASLVDADTICKSFNSASQAVNGIFSFSSDLASLQTLFDNYFSFDPAIFAQITGEIIVAFAVGFGAGGVIKLMTKR